MLRIRVDAEDLARTRLVPTTGPMSETLFGLLTLRSRSPGRFLAPWRRTVAAGPYPWSGPMAPFGRWLEPVDLITVVGRAATMAEATEAIRAAGRGVVRDEIMYAAAYAARHDREPGWPAWVRDLPDDRGLRDQLGAATGECYDTLIAPHWNAIRGHLDSEFIARARVLAESGIERLLASLHPQIQWRPPHLEVDSPWVSDMELVLGGSGLTLAPSVFQQSVYVSWPLVGSDPPILRYPALRTLADAYRLWYPHGAATADRALVALLGATRARVLEEVNDGRTTNQLATRIGVSAPTASHHATVLRNSGLIITQRIGGAVRHTLTPLGRQLLSGAPNAT